jgi:hypothetical protein
VPEDRGKAFREMKSKAARDQFFQQWAEERARARQVDGVYVLVCKSPRYAVAVLGPDTEERVFPQRDRISLAEELKPGGLWPNYDKKLRDAVSWFHSDLHHNLRAGGPEDAGRVWPGALAVIAGLLLFWGALVVARHALELLGHPPGAAEPAAPAEKAVAAALDDGAWRGGGEHAEGLRTDLERRAEEW